VSSYRRWRRGSRDGGVIGFLQRVGAAADRPGMPGRSECTLLTQQEEIMSLSTILLIVLVILLVGALPTWPYSTSWGYYPSGGLGLVVLILLILLLAGRI
jgi:hypothetical protein